MTKLLQCLRDELVRRDYAASGGDARDEGGRLPLPTFLDTRWGRTLGRQHRASDQLTRRDRRGEAIRLAVRRESQWRRQHFSQQQPPVGDHPLVNARQSATVFCTLASIAARST